MAQALVFPTAHAAPARELVSATVRDGSDLFVDKGLRIPALDGYRLAATLYEPDPAHDRDVAVVISSATAVRRGYYDAYARFLAGRGFWVLTFDYRGIGDSRPKRLSRFRATATQWGEEDLAGAIRWVSDHLQPKKLLAVGHSIGGQILGLTINAGKVDAMLAVASQSGYWGHWPSPSRYRMAFNWWVAVPVVSRLWGYLPGYFGTKEDLPGGVAREWASWCRNPDYLHGRGGERLRSYDRFRGPLLAYSFDDDPYAPRTAVESLLAGYRNARVTHRHLSPADVGAPALGHFGFFREGFRGTLWAESAAWLEKQA